MSFLFSILLVQLSYIYWSCIPVFFQLWWWLVHLMTFTFGMPWRKEGKYRGKGKPQRPRYSSLVCHHLAPVQCRVAQRSPCFTTGKEALSQVSHTSQASPALKRRQLPQLWTLHLVLQISGGPAPSRCSARGRGGKRDNCMGKDAVCWHWGCLTIS